MINNINKTILYTFLICINFQFYSCRKSIDYLSETDKKYLFYNLGDTIIFRDKNDTLYGYVTEKEFEISSSRDIMGKSYQYETGILRINSLENLASEIANIYIANPPGETEIFYKFFTESLNRKTDSCYNNTVEFNAILRNGNFVEYSEDKGEFIDLKPINKDIYEFVGYCNYPKNFKMQISKSRGISLLFFSEKDSLFISKF